MASRRVRMLRDHEAEHPKGVGKTLHRGCEYEKADLGIIIDRVVEWGYAKDVILPPVPKPEPTPKPTPRSRRMKK